MYQVLSKNDTMSVMKKVDKETLKNKIDLTMPILNEYQQRMCLAAEANALGHGGISLISQLSGVTIKTIRSGIKELNDPNREPMPSGKSRSSGGGRKRVVDKQPNILNRLQASINRATHKRRPRACFIMDK